MNPELNSQLARVRTSEMLALASRTRSQSALVTALRALRARRPR
jgi:hypothetical protein